MATMLSSARNEIQSRSARLAGGVDAWNELWVGAALAHDRFLRVDVTERRTAATAHWTWRLC
jgi:hypothetical protein